jgi:outer membrane protein OmpU
MKSILLTTTALVAFAGAAVADGHTGVSFGGDAELGYNNDIKDSFYWNFGATLKAAQDLDNGITASISADIVLDSANTFSGGDVTADDFVLKLATENASLSFGDVDAVAEDNYGGVSGETVTGFTEKSGPAILAAEVTFGDVTAMVSYEVDSEATNPQFYATGSFGAVTAELGYEAAADGNDAITGVSASTALAGADVTVAYMTDGTETSTGVGVSMAIGIATVSGYVSSNKVAENEYGVAVEYADGPLSATLAYDADQSGDNTEVTAEGSYDLGNGLTVLAGVISTKENAATATTANYIAGSYDLGGGATLLMSYADDKTTAGNDEIGDPEYMQGTTVEVSFKF